MAERIALTGVEIVEDGRAVRLRWADGAAARFHAVWLRDNAPDPQTLDPRNGQRLITVLDLPEDVRCIAADVDGDALAVGFAPEGRTVRFPSGWLRGHRYDGGPSHAGHGAPPAHAEPWDGTFRDLPRADFTAARRDPAVLAGWLAAVERWGFALMHGVPVRDHAVTGVVDLFGYVRETNYGRVFDVRTEVDPVNLAYTGLGLQVHTDNPYRDPVPTLQLLHCLANDAEGGESVLVDGFRAAALLQAEAPEDFALLAGHSVPFAYRGAGGVDLRARAPMIRLSPEGVLLGVRFNNRSAAAFDLPYEVMPRYYAAYRRFAQILERPDLAVTFKMMPGDLFIVDNERVLHGRTAYAGAGSRHLQGCYADRDGLLSRLSTLRAGGGEVAA